MTIHAAKGIWRERFVVGCATDEAVYLSGRPRRKVSDSIRTVSYPRRSAVSYDMHHEAEGT